MRGHQTAGGERAALLRGRAGVYRWQLLLCLCLALSLSVHATSVVRLSFEALCKRAALIFEGRVLAVRPYTDPGSGLIWTRVTFAVDERIHGAYEGQSVTLDFLGGQVGARQLVVTDMQVPALGETGVYFVATLARRQPHPLIGWSQGHFLVNEPAGYVASADGRRILAIEPEVAERSMALSTGRAGGVLVASSSASAVPGLSPGAFRDRIRAAVGRGDDGTMPGASR